MRIAAFVLLGITGLGLVVLFNSAYIVAEWEQVVVTEFGKPVESVTSPGLHFKKPFIQKTTYFEKRILEWDGEDLDILTGDKETIRVNTFARWKIVNPLRFYESLRTVDRGQGLLDDRIDDAVQTIIKTHPLMEVLRDTGRELQYTTPELEEIERAKNISISIGRSQVVAKILKRATEGTEEAEGEQASGGAGRVLSLEEQYGIKLIDVRIKQINYVPKVIENIFNRMRSERKRIKERYEAEGTSRKEEIEGEVEREKARLESEGEMVAKQIRGRADAEALHIYADAYQRDPEFYSFLKTLETYEKTFGPKMNLILSTDSEFFKYLKEFKRQE